ncbi:MAG: SAF domain-containing protein [Acidimicrobiales bacterium]
MTATLPTSSGSPPSGSGSSSGPGPLPPRPTAAARSVGRRTGRIPSGRALLGALLVALAALGLFAVYLAARSGPTTRYVVAAQPIAPGTEVGADDIELATIELPDEVEAGAFTQVDELIGTVTVAPISQGELVQRSAVTADAQPGSPGFTMSFAVEADRAAGGRLEPGQLVTIVVTYTGGQQAVTEVVAQDATVISFARAGDAALDALDESVLTVRLPATANPLAVAHAARVGEITIIDPTFAGDAPLPAGFQPDVPGGGADTGADAETTETDGDGEGS